MNGGRTYTVEKACEDVGHLKLKFCLWQSCSDALLCVCVENSLEDIILIIPVFPGALRICIVCDQLTPRNSKGIVFFCFFFNFKELFYL